MPKPLQPDDPAALGRYRLIARLGRGGMGTVFLSQDDLGRRVAVKVINAELAGEPKFQDRFRREVAAARKVRRFCTAPVLDASLDAQPMYVVTEYIDGPTLEDAVMQGGPMQGSALEGLAVGMAVALSAIHDAGIVHRDLKPANVLLSGVGPRVIDFGISRALDGTSGITKAGQIIGTPAYMAPELINGNPVSPASDVFSWGCVVAFAGTGQDPFIGHTVTEIIQRVVHEPPWLHRLDAELLDIVAQALSKDPASRPTVPALLNHLAGHGQDPVRLAAAAVPPQGAVRSGPVNVPPEQVAQSPLQPTPLREPTRRLPQRYSPTTLRTAGIIGGAVGFLALTVLAAFLLWPDKDSAADKGAGLPQQPVATRSAVRSETPPTSAAAVDPGDVDRRFIGRWAGLIHHQSSNSSTFPAVITITGGKVADEIGRSEYSTEGCSGSLVLVTASKTRLVVEEHIDQGNGLCKKVVTITLTYHAGTLQYEYRFSDARGTGTLRK